MKAHPCPPFIHMDFHNCDLNSRLTKNVEGIILYHEKQDRGVGVLEGELFVVKRILVCMCLNSQVQGRWGIVLHPPLVFSQTVSIVENKSQAK